VFWKDLPEHNPTKLGSAQGSNFIAGDDFSKINHTNNHINYYCKNKVPRILNLVGPAR
jgi:hypothetical protein